MPFFQTPHHQFHYLKQGEQTPAVLMLHSTGIGSWQWKPYMEQLAPRLTLALDLMGYPPSDDWVKTESALENDFEGAEHLLLMQKGAVDLIGHSYGGFLALQLAKKHPGKIKTMLLHEPVAWGSIYDSGRIDLHRSFDKLCKDLFSEGSDVDVDQWLLNFVSYWNTSDTWRLLPEKTKNIWRSRFSKVYAEVSTLCLDRTPLSNWSSLDHPICITLSDNSPEHEKEVCELLSSTMPNATLIQHGGGHLAPMTHFNELSSILKSWFQD